MKKAFLALLLLAGAAAMTVGVAFADISDVSSSANYLRPTSKLLKAEKEHALGTSAVTYDTTHVGYSSAHAPVAGNYWNVFASSVNRPNTGDPASVTWDFEDLTAAHGDSLQGWWPVFHGAGVLGTALSDDHGYVYACLDAGNMTNYKIPGTNQRTYGVIGVWHADPGAGAGVGVTWTPMSGTQSAWCGLRQHHDASVMDTQTNNPYNSDAADMLTQFRGLTVKNFPGYCNQWDQLLYRDFAAVEGQDLTLSFMYRTRMSTAFTAGAGRRGWFHGDPLSVTDGNFISSFTQNGPIDSFSVYVGVPVDDAAVTLSTGAVAPVYDTQRRWFSEVLRIWDGPTAPYFEVLGKTGINPADPDTTGFNLFSAVLPWTGMINDIVHSPFNAGGKVRLVFRVKTNNTGADNTSSTWGEVGGRGAAQIDDVTVQWGVGTPAVIGDFEGAEGTAGNINNAIGTSSETYWKSTGKPPALYCHATNLAGLPWNDVCGPVGAGTRICDMQGNVIDGGVEPTHTIGDPSYEAGKNGYYGIISPTINLAATGTSLLNNQDLDSTKAGGSQDYYVSYDINTADLQVATGVLWFVACQAYPNLQAGTGAEVWSDVCTRSLWADGIAECFRMNTDDPLKGNAQVFTSLPSGKPDSLRLYLAFYNFPLRFGAGANAQPTDGAYFDNINLTIINKGGTADRVGTIARDVWHTLCDAFPSATTVTLGPGTFASSLDTCGALIKNSFNLDTTPSGTPPNDILGDTMVVSAPDLSAAAGDTNSLSIRMDMIFRILPGPGNYRSNVGDVTPHYPPVAGMALLRRPDDRTTLVNPANPADSSFWAAYINVPGQFSSPSPHAGGVWDHLTWNSARMDTSETNQFPTHNVSTTFPTARGTWMNALHEGDPHYGILGISRPRCFVIDTTLYTNLTNANVVCGSAPSWLSPEIPGTTPPREYTGWDGTVTTTEMTKIIPDGLLTPGSHVQWFVRKQQIYGNVGGFAMSPDTATISPQASEVNNTDAHRWQQFSVLPDRWKDTQFGGSGMACMLLLDYDDRRGDERVWVSAMDSTNGTAAGKYGAHNGWHAVGNGHSLNKDVNTNLQAEAFVYGKNAQPGSLWDMYQVRAVESGNAAGTRVGARFATLGTGLLTGKDATTAPTPLMLKQFYSSIVLLSGDLNSDVLGPFLGCPEDDIRILGDFLNDAGGLLGKPRSLYVAGMGFVSAEVVDPVHEAFLANQLRTTLVAPSYRDLAANSGGCSDLISTSVISASNIYGTGLSCSFQDDVIAANTLVPGGSNVTQFTNTGAGPYYAGVYHAPDNLNPDENYVSLVNSFDMRFLWGRYCATSFGRPAYLNDLKTKIFGSVCSAWATAIGGVDVPQTASGIANYMKIGNSVVRSGNATVSFGVATTGRVRVRLYDVTGRLVRTLADRTFPGGQAQMVKWDGRDNSGNQAARGVYFARIDYASGAAINGRVVVLQ